MLSKTVAMVDLNEGFMFNNDKILEMAKTGGLKFLEALNRFFRDSSLINEINDRADKELFLPAASSQQYHHIEDIKENDIYDKFVERCFNQQTFGIDINKFVDENYPHKTKETKEYIVGFFNQLSLIILNVLKENAAPDIKIILREQEISVATILDRLTFLEEQIAATAIHKEPTYIVEYCANMQQKRWEISQYKSAIKDKEIARTISLTLSNSTLSQENGQLFWANERVSLLRNFERKVLPLLEEGASISVFGFAPIPLLVLYGNQFANRPNVDIYQLKKDTSTWEWEARAPKLDIKTHWYNKINTSNAAIMLSFSGKVNIDKVEKCIDLTSFSIVELSIDEPYDDFLRSKEQLNEFILAFRKVKSQFESLGVKKIPIGFAISIGQAYNPNYDAQLVTYDYKQGVYTKVFTIGGDE